ncbi:MAG TPA: hypothetical protein VH210_01135 [Gaiellaceae bacterium]|nr:hypothetical protein [Gaiellaceae bacterium]
MASNRLASDASSTTDQVAPETPNDTLVTVARHAARIQIAAFSAAGNALAGWARAAERLAQTVADELVRRVDGDGDTRGSIVRVASAANDHLRELTALPSAAANHFDARLSRAPIDKQEVVR